MHKFVELDKASLVLVDFTEEILHIWDGNFQGLKQRNCQVELLEGNLLVVILINFVENRPESVVVSDVLDKVGKLCL